MEPRIMTQPETDIAARATRRDGWTQPRRARFLECLATTANVKHACAMVGLSRQTAYRLQARDPVFAAAWDEALEEAREAATRAFLAALPEPLRRTLSGSSSTCHLQPEPLGRRDARLLAQDPVTVVNLVSP